MARPRTVQDEQLLEAAQDLLFELGPAFTLERVASRAGVSAATLIKRFGSKRELLLALNRRWLDSLGPELDALTAAHATALGRLRAVANWGFDDLDRPDNAATQLTALAHDLQDDEMRAQLRAGWQVLGDRLTRLARAAIAAGELPAAPSATQVARILLALGEGTRITWSVAPRGSLVRRARADVDAVLDAWGAAPRS
ncbi:MAG: hypothetical protein QOJ60_314 [Actinomycetota bacterium]|jgi:AcrR family transcriptional regulator|nr:hypothetical protein [Actinomycetota bacterium]